MSMQPQPSTVEVVMEIVRERLRLELDRKLTFSAQEFPNVPNNVPRPVAYFGLPTADAARMLRDDSFKRGTGSYAHLLVEDVSSAIEHVNDPLALRAELVRLAAGATAWVEKIDRDIAAAGARA